MLSTAGLRSVTMISFSPGRVLWAQRGNRRRDARRGRERMIGPGRLALIRAWCTCILRRHGRSHRLGIARHAASRRRRRRRSIRQKRRDQRGHHRRRGSRRCNLNGAAYVFTRADAGSPTATWTQTAKLPTHSRPPIVRTSVSVDGNLAAVGCYLKEKASVFVRDTPGDPTSSWATGGDPRDRRRRQTRSRQRQGRGEGLQPLRRRAR